MNLIKQLCKYNTIYTTSRLLHSDHYAKILVPLNHRKLLKVSGKDAPNFLQGLITNDMRHFEEGANSMYAMFLNNKGRVLYDALLYKWENNDSFLIECDNSILETLKKHLKLYKLKQVVNIEDMNNTLSLWVLISPINNIPAVKVDTKSPLNIYKDPRLTELGSRIVSIKNMTDREIINLIAQEKQAKLGETEIYTYLRYTLGVGEGPEELPPGLCFPLELNCDYLHGVSFHKGCYIGQELTARVYHTGVVRKRMMPIKFNREITGFLDKDCAVKSAKDPKLTLGKLKGFVHDYGLGIVRIKEALETKTLQIGGYTGQIVKPNWWPLEAPKEKITITKTE